MPLLLPARSNDYQVTRDTPLDVNIWLATVCDIAKRLNELETQRTDLQQIIDTGTSQAIAIVNENLGPLIAQINLQIEDLNIQLSAALQSAAAAQSAAEDAQEFATSILNSGEVTASPQITLKAFGSIAKGQVVGLRSDGKAAGLKVGGPFGMSPVTTTGATGLKVASNGAGAFVLAYIDGSNSSYGTAMVATVSGETVTFGTPVVFNAATTTYISVAYDAAAGKFVIAFQDGGNSSYGSAIVGTVSGTSISFGTKAVFKSAAASYISIAYDANAAKHLIAFIDGGNSNKLAAVVGTVSGTSISFGTVAALSSSAASSVLTAACYHPSAQKTVIAYRDTTNKGTAVVASISGTTVSFGSAVAFDAAMNSTPPAVVFDSVNDRIVIIYSASSLSAVVASVSGTVITCGSPVVFAGSATLVSVSYNPAGYVMISSQLVPFVVNGMSGAFGDAYGSIGGIGNNNVLSYDPVSANSVYFFVRTTGVNGIGARTLSTPGAATTSSRIGIAKNAANDGDNVNVVVAGGKSGDQSGLTANTIYYIDDTNTLTSTSVLNSKIGRALSATELLVELAA